LLRAAGAVDMEETLMKTAEPPRQSEMNPADQAPPGTPGTGDSLCPECSGKGTVNGERCEACGGTGTVTEGVGGA
jgi:RecJ-like exonuclease